MTDTRRKSEFIYAIAVLPERDIHKIGRATSPWRRFANLQVGNHCFIEMTATVEPSFDCIQAEKRLHTLFRYERIRGEWYRVSRQRILAALQHIGTVTEHPQANEDDIEAMREIMKFHPKEQVSIQPRAITADWSPKLGPRIALDPVKHARLVKLV